MTETTEPQEKPKTLTSYTVLREIQETSQARDPEGDQFVYRVVHIVSAQSAAAARAAAFNGMDEADQIAGATLVAVPTRSWVPKRRELVSTPRSVES